MAERQNKIVACVARAMLEAEETGLGRVELLDAASAIADVFRGQTQEGITVEHCIECLRQLRGAGKLPETWKHALRGLL